MGRSQALMTLLGGASLVAVVAYFGLSLSGSSDERPGAQLGQTPKSVDRTSFASDSTTHIFEGADSKLELEAKREETRPTTLNMGPSAPTTAGKLPFRIIRGDQPVAGADIYLLPADENEDPEYFGQLTETWLASGNVTRSNSVGAYSIARASEERSEVLLVRKAGLAWFMELLEPGQELPALIKMESALELGGTVRDVHGRGIEGARIIRRHYVPGGVTENHTRFQRIMCLLLSEVSRSDANGRFAFSECSNDLMDLVVSASGFAESQYVHIVPPSVCAITLVAGTSVFGTVLDENGMGVEGALVKTLANGSLPEAATPYVSTEKDGSYRIDNAHSGSISIVVWSDDRHPVERIWTMANPGSENEINIRLGTSANIKGFVRDVSGRALSGVSLAFLSMKTGIEISLTESDEQGRFDASGLSSGESYRIRTYDTDKYTPIHITDVAAGTEDLDIQVFPLARLVIHSKFESEEPESIDIRMHLLGDLEPKIGGSELVIHQYFRQVPARSRKIKKDGSVSSKYWSGIYDIELSAPGYKIVRLNDFALAPNTPPIDVLFEVETLRSGRVVDIRTDSPIANAQVQLLSRFQNGKSIAPFEGIRCTTQGDGSFQFNGLPNGPSRLRVTADGYAWKTISGDSSSFANLTSELLLIKLGIGGQVEGVVNTDYSNPSSTVEVTVRTVGEEDGQAQFVDSLGRFSFEHVPTGLVEVALRDHYYQAAFPGADEIVRQVLVDEGKVTFVGFDAATGVSLLGRLENWDQPVLIEARLIDNESFRVTGACLTDPKGLFYIPHLLPGKYWVGANTGEPGFSVSASLEIEISSTEPEPITLRVPTTRILGFVIDPAGVPISKAMIAVYESPLHDEPEARCLTNGDGKFEIGGLREGMYDILVSAFGMASDVVSGVAVPANTPVMQLVSEGKLIIEVVDDLGTVVPGARVFLVDGRHTKLDRRGLSSEEGTVYLDSLGPRSYGLRVEKNGYVSAISEEVSITTAVTTSKRVTLVRLGAVDVTIRNEEKRPLPGLDVTLFDGSGDAAVENSKRTSVKGIAHFGALTPGEYVVAVGPVEKWVEVLPGETTEIDIELPK